MMNGECDRKGCCKDIELVGVQHVMRVGSPTAEKTEERCGCQAFG